jgi:HAD superfamily hydrolase (TIGR01509 family)
LPKKFLPKIKNIIFDLGGVLIDIDYHKTINAFKNLGVVGFEDMYSQTTANTLFEDLETGQINEAQFYDGVRKEANIPLNDEQIKTAWNTILLDFRPNSIAYLQQLAKTHRVYLLSNTNSIHQAAFLQTYADIFKGHLNDNFTKAYYSHEINLRKPHKNIYEFVLTDAGINAEETLFIDDSIINIPAANEMGITTHLLIKGQKIEDIIPTYLTSS